MESEVLDVLTTLDEAQRAAGIRGGLGEIGVHHGKLFIGLHLLRRDGERSVAIDVFGDQVLNVDASGNGDLAKFRANIALWADEDGLVVHQGDSTALDAATLRDLAGGPLRMLSVDGGHTADTVLSDLRLAEAVLLDGGVVIADDVFNQRWPGVADGTQRYLAEGGALVPFAIGFNKVFLTQDGRCAAYREALRSAFADRFRLTTVDSAFAGQEVALLVRESPVDLLRRSRAARTAYHGAYRSMVRALRAVSGR
jgi:hypothetical protein